MMMMMMVMMIMMMMVMMVMMMMVMMMMLMTRTVIKAAYDYKDNIEERIQILIMTARKMIVGDGL